MANSPALTKPNETPLRDAVNRYVGLVHTTAIFAARGDLREDDKRRLAEAWREMVAIARDPIKEMNCG